MELTWYIESDLDDSKQLVDAVERNGDTYKSFDYHYQLEDKYPRLFHSADCGILYGSMQTMMAESSRVMVYPGVWLDDQLKCTEAWPRLGEYLFNSNYRILPLREIARLKDEIYWGGGDVVNQFIRPNSSLKPFNGQVVKYDDFDKWYNNTALLGLSPNTLCIIAPDSNILMEERFIVSEGKVITGSIYMQNGEKVYKPHNRLTAKWVEWMLKKTEYNPYPVFIVDVATEWRPDMPRRGVLEIGSVNCCGLYDCDIDAFVKVVSDMAKREYNEYISV